MENENINEAINITDPNEANEAIALILNDNLELVPEPNKDVPDQDEIALLTFTQNIINALTLKHNIASPIACELDGKTTKIKFKRIPEGYTIRIGARAFADTYLNFITRIVHEVAHIINDSNYVEDALGNGSYHSEAFKTTAELLGLTCTWGKGSGYASSVTLDHGIIPTITAGPLPLNDFMIPPTSALIVTPKPSPTNPKGKGGFKAKIYEIVVPVDLPAGATIYVQKDQLVSPEEFDAQQIKEAEQKAAKEAAEPNNDELNALM
jgi:hypothetical protein